MTLIRKFYDVAEAQGGGADTEVLDAPVDTAPKQSIAALMAAQGTKTTENTVHKPTAQDILPKSEAETKLQTKTEALSAEKTVDTTTSQTPDVKAEAKKESPTKQEEVKVEAPKPQTEEVQQPKLSLQEILKTEQPDNVLKALGYDDKVVGFMKDLKELDPKMLAFLETWKSNGDLKSYLREMTTDYSKMPPEDVMKHQLREEYPKASDKALELLLRTKVIEKYNLNSDDPEEVEEGRMLLEAESDKYRDEMIARQNEKLLPKPPEPKQEQPDNSAELQKQEFDKYVSTVNDNPLTKELINTKKITIGEGDDKYNHPVADPKAITDILFDSDKWANSFFTKTNNPDGTVTYVPDVEKQLFVAAAVLDHKGLQREMAKHYLSLGGERAIKPIENAKPPEGDKSTRAEKQPQTAAEAMAKQGRINAGGGFTMNV